MFCWFCIYCFTCTVATLGLITTVSMPSSFSALIALTKIVTSKFEILVENKFWHDHNFWSQFKKPPYLMLHYILTSFKPGCQSSQILRPDRCEALQTRGSTPEVVKIVKPIVKREWPQQQLIWCGSGEPNRPPIKNFLQQLRPCHMGGDKTTLLGFSWVFGSSPTFRLLKIQSLVKTR